jgi:endonuclease/exonuclease/phosphatase family metal-dependent hydrolase
MARELDMNVVWGCEFEEIKSWWRSAKLQGGGEHGNAILSRFPIVNSGCVRHATIYDWEAHGWMWQQPRRGGRVFVWADVLVPQCGDTRVRCYSAHFENVSGCLGRLKQCAELLTHWTSDGAHARPSIIGGDFNTIQHGLIRFSPMAYDAVAWTTLGYSESDVWRQCYLESFDNDRSLIEMRVCD